MRKILYLINFMLCTSCLAIRKKIKAINLLLFLFSAFSACHYSYAENKDVIVVSSITCKPIANSNNWEMIVNLVFTNKENYEVCILPSEIFFEIQLIYKGDQIINELTGSSTYSTRSKSIPNENISYIIIGKKQKKEFQLTRLFSSSLIVGEADMKVVLECAPFDTSVLYKNIPIYKNKETFRSKVMVSKDNASNLVIVPIS